MPDIHVYVGESEQSVYPEEQIPELLAQGVLTPDIYYWREGMTQWRPLSAFKPASQSVVPERRTAPLPDFSNLPPPPEREAPVPVRETGSWVSSRRFRFRRQPEPLSTILQVLLMILMLVTLLELAAGTFGLGSGGTSTSTGDSLFEILECTGLGLNLLLLLCYCFWIYRTNLNCRNFSSVLAFTSRWAVGCHFVPVMNLVRPYQAMQEIWRVSNNPWAWQNDPPSVLVAIWWTLWLFTAGLAEAWLFFAHSPNEIAIFIALKLVQVAWYGTFLAVVTLVLRKQLKLVKSAKRRKDHIPLASADDTSTINPT